MIEDSKLVIMLMNEIKVSESLDEDKQIDANINLGMVEPDFNGMSNSSSNNLNRSMSSKDKIKRFRMARRTKG